MIYLLLVVLAIELITFVIICRGDWLHPAVIVPLAFLFSIICATYNIDLWDINLSSQTFIIIAGGVALFSIIAFAVSERKPRSHTHSIGRIDLERWQLVALFVFFLGVTALYYLWVRSSFSALGVADADWNEAMYERRTASADVELSSYTNMPTYVVYAYNTMQAVSIVILYILINNVFSKEGRSYRDLPLAFCLCIYLASVVLKGGRLPILEMAFASALIIWVVWHRRCGWRGVIRGSYIIGAACIGAGVLVAFSALREVVGRQNDSDLLSYITSYAGGSIQLFDMYLSDPAAPNTLFGQETFRGIWSALIRHVGIADAFSWQLEFRSSNGVIIGNVYTAFRYWIHDFGYYGAVAVLLFYAIFYSQFYSHLVNHSNEKLSYLITIYAFIFSGLVMLPIQDVLLAMRLNPGNIYMMACILFFDWYLIERRRSSAHSWQRDRKPGLARSGDI